MARGGRTLERAGRRRSHGRRHARLPPWWEVAVSDRRLLQRLRLYVGQVDQVRRVLSDARLAELVARASEPAVVDGFPASTGGEGRGGSGVSSVEAAIV